MERQPGDTNRVSEIRRIPYRTTMKLGRGNEVNGRGLEEYEKTIRQEKKKFIRIKGQRQHVVREQNIHLNRPSKKLDQKRYEPFRISKNIGLGVF